MISFLRGCLRQKLSQSLLLDVHGVGYEVRVTPRLWQATREGSEIEVYTHFHVREDAQILFGFSDLHERDMFRTLLGVSGIGPKTAMAVLSAADPETIVRAVQTDDTAALKAPGVGPKIVKRIVSELKSAFAERFVSNKGVAMAKGTGLHADLQEALLQLGYHEREIADLLREADLEGLSVEKALRVILKKTRG